MDPTQVTPAASGPAQQQAPNVPATGTLQRAGTIGYAIDRRASPARLEGDPFLSRENSPSRQVPGRAQSNESISGTPPPPQLQPPPQSHAPLSTINRLTDRDNIGRQDSRYGPVSGHYPATAPPPAPAVQLADDQFDQSPQRQHTADSNFNRLSAMHQSPRNSQVTHAASYDPANEKRVATITSRIRTTIENAERERDKYAAKAKVSGLALNVAIGLQVLLGSLTTGLSGVAISSGKSIAASTTVLGAFATLVASYLARARGSNEPELSIARVKDLDQFLRECKNFEGDHGAHTGHDYDKQLDYYRARFENLLGNGNEERRMSSA